MRRITKMLMEIAAIRNPKKAAKYREYYPIIDNSLQTGIDARSGPLSQTQLAEVMTAADFPFALGEFVDRAMWPAYTRLEFNYTPLVYNDTLPNFMTVTRYQRQSGLDDLEMIGEKRDTKAGYQLDATKREYRVYRWAKQYDFSYEAIVNDDLGYFDEHAALMGDSARRTLEKFVSRLYFNATFTASMVILGVLYAGTGRLTTNNLMTAWHAYTQRLDARAEHIRVAPVHLVIHSGLELVARQIQRSVQVAELATNAVNVLPPLNIVVDPYITGAAPNLPWFLFSQANVGGIRPMVLARLQGRPGPLIIQKQPDQTVFSGFGRTGGTLPMLGDFETGDIMLRVEDVWGAWADGTYAGVTDYRGVYYSSGTTP